MMTFKVEALFPNRIFADESLDDALMIDASDSFGYSAGHIALDTPQDLYLLRDAIEDFIISHHITPLAADRDPAD